MALAIAVALGGALCSHLAVAEEASVPQPSMADATTDAAQAPASDADAASLSSSASTADETAAQGEDAAPSLESVVDPSTAASLEAQGLSGLPDTKGGLVIDGSSLTEKTSICIKAIPEYGHIFNGLKALRFFALVYDKNADGTYTPSGVFGDADSEGKLPDFWDAVQRDTAAQDYQTPADNLDWHDNRLVQCAVAPGQVVVVYPIAWDDSCNGFNWFAGGSWNNSDRENFIANAQPDSSSWSFSYQIGLANARSGVVTGVSCSDDAQAMVSNGDVVSTRSVRTGEVHTVCPEVTSAPSCPSKSTPLITLKFTGLDDITFSEFKNDFALWAKVPSNGMNGDLFSHGGSLGLDFQILNAAGQETWGGYLSSENRCDAQGKWDVINNGEDVWRLAYADLKAGGSLTLYAADGHGIYDFTYSIGDKGDNQPITVDSVVNDQTGASLAKDSSGAFIGESPLSWLSPRHVSLTVDMSRRGNQEPFGTDETGLPNYGLRLAVDRDSDQAASGSGSLAITPVLRISAPSVLRNGEGGGSQSVASVTVAMYVKNKATGRYQPSIYAPHTVYATYPDSGLYTLDVEEEWFAERDVVFIVYPTDAVSKGEYEFSYQLLGTRGTAWKIDGFQKVDGLVDPLDSGAAWQTVDGLGTYGDCTPVQTLSSFAGKQRSQTLKVNVSRQSEETAAAEINGASPDVLASTQKGAVVIRNNATDYTSQDTADGMPDVQVTIKAPELDENTGSPLYWGYSDTQFPYQAFLYTYDENGGTYSKISTSAGCYHECDSGGDPQSILCSYYGNTHGPAYSPWGVAANGTSTFHSHLADNQAIVILPRTSPHAFSYQVTILNHDKYTVKSCETNGGSFDQTRENLFESGALASYATDNQEVTLDTEKTVADNQTFELLSKSLPSNETMKTLPVTLFDYDFPGLTDTDYTGQSSQLKFLLDPLNRYDASVNHIGNDKTAVFDGIVKGDLGSDGLPVFNYTTPFSLFDSSAVGSQTNGGTKTVEPANFQFVYDTDTNTYSYNSHEHHAQLEDDGTVYQYDHGLGLFGWDSKAAGFFPFNRWENVVNSGIGNWGSASTNNASTYLLDGSSLDYHFGLSMAEDFTIPEGGKVMGNDMLFTFSGDDDVWLFIDGKLVLDMGGIHEAVEGEVNLTQGTYTVNGVEHDLSEALGTYSDFGAAGDGAWAANSKHTFKLFYLERGGTLSNLDISFNLPVIVTPPAPDTPSTPATPATPATPSSSAHEMSAGYVEDIPSTPNTGDALPIVPMPLVILGVALVLFGFLAWGRKRIDRRD